MDPLAMSYGTMVGTELGSIMERAPASAERRRRIVSATTTASLAVAGLVLTMLPAYALPPDTLTPNIFAPNILSANILAPDTPAAVTAPAEKIVVAAKVRGAGAAAGARLLNNGTRSRESREEEAEKAAQKAADDEAAKAAPAPAAAAPQPATPHAGATVEQREPQKPIAGLGQGTSDMECVANCARSTPTVRVGGGRQAPNPSLTEGGMECVAGCYGVNMTSVIVNRDELPAASPQGSGATNNRITVLRGVTRTKSYTPAD